MGDFFFLMIIKIEIKTMARCGDAKNLVFRLKIPKLKVSHIPEVKLRASWSPDHKRPIRDVPYGAPASEWQG